MGEYQLRGDLRIMNHYIFLLSIAMAFTRIKGNSILRDKLKNSCFHFRYMNF